MAGDLLEPRAWLAKSLHAAAAFIDEPVRASDAQRWASALERYQLAAADCDQHYRDVYEPACRRFGVELASVRATRGPEVAAASRPTLFREHGISDIETSVDALNSVRHEHMLKLMSTPAPTLTALSLKLELLARALIDEHQTSMMPTILNDIAKFATRHE